VQSSSEVIASCIALAGKDHVTRLSVVLYRIGLHQDFSDSMGQTNWDGVADLSMSHGRGNWKYVAVWKRLQPC